MCVVSTWLGGLKASSADTYGIGKGFAGGEQINSKFDSVASGSTMKIVV